MLSGSFLSIVQPLGEPGGPQGRLLVRARVKGDLERVFWGCEVTETPNRDYRFRALIKREVVAQAMAAEVRKIHYDNFKSSVKEDDRHDAYFRCWSAMNGLQYSRLPRVPYRGQLRQTRRGVVRDLGPDSIPTGLPWWDEEPVQR